MNRYRHSSRAIKGPDGIAAILSVVPGLGHIYKGRYLQGFCIFIGDAVIAMGIVTAISLAYAAACILQGIQVSTEQALTVLFSSPMIIGLFGLPLLLYWIWTTLDAFYEPDLRHHQEV